MKISKANYRGAILGAVHRKGYRQSKKAQIINQLIRANFYYDWVVEPKHYGLFIWSNTGDITIEQDERLFYVVLLMVSTDYLIMEMPQQQTNSDIQKFYKSKKVNLKNKLQ